MSGRMMAALLTGAATMYTPNDVLPRKHRNRPKHKNTKRERKRRARRAMAKASRRQNYRIAKARS